MMWNRELLEKLKTERARAIERGAEVFTFEGQQVLVAYAKYLIQHLETQLKPITLNEIEKAYNAALDEE